MHWIARILLAGMQNGTTDKHIMSAIQKISLVGIYSRETKTNARPKAHT